MKTTSLPREYLVQCITSDLDLLNQMSHSRLLWCLLLLAVQNAVYPSAGGGPFSQFTAIDSLHSADRSVK